ncbi:MAG: radical SAM protein [Bacteroidota bacterium]
MCWFNYFTFLKFINALKILLSYLLSIGFKKVFLWGKPISLTVEPTNFCNLQCPECPTGNNTIKREKGFLSISNYTKIIDTLAPWLLYHMIYFQGEPFLHPDIFSMIHYAHQRKIYTCTSTNGHFLSYENALKIINSGLDKIIISVDGVTQETYEKYRKGGSLKKVISGIQTLSTLKKSKKSKTPEIVIQFLVFRFNEHQINDIKKLGKSLGANRVEIKSAQMEQDIKNWNLIPQNKELSRYQVINNQFKLN